MTDDLPLFGWSPPAPSAPKPDQAAELARCLSALERHIMTFLRGAILKPESRQFHMGQLTAFVQERQRLEGVKPCAPDSPRRVLGELKAMGCADVRLLNRRASLYEVVAVSEE